MDKKLGKWFDRQLDFAISHQTYKDCPYYPCHKFPDEQDSLNCLCCFCPFYPCGITSRGGKWIESDTGKSWDCSECSFIHRDDVVKRILELLYEKTDTKSINQLIKKEFTENSVAPVDNLVVGIMGKVGSGKSTVSNILKDEFGFNSLDVDKFGHEALENEKSKLVQHFGENILNSAGKIDRHILGNIVFSSPEKLAILNSIVHPRMKKEIYKIIHASEGKKFVIDAALLFEMGLDELCHFTVCVETPEKEIINRVSKYRKWPKRKIKKILKSQIYLDFLKDKTSFVIFNNKGNKKLHKQIEFFVHTIL